jgi:hypothetical protein
MFLIWALLKSMTFFKKLLRRENLIKLEDQTVIMT